MANVTVKALKDVFLSGGRALAAGETAEMDEIQARGYPGDEIEILGPAGAEETNAERGTRNAERTPNGNKGAPSASEGIGHDAARKETASDEPNADPKPRPAPAGSKPQAGARG